MVTFELLLAKPIKDGRLNENAALLSHSLHTAEVFTTIFGNEKQPTRQGEKWMCFFKSDKRSIEFFRLMPLVCYLHDIGKANSGFQEAVRGKPDAQVIRHEHLSGLLLWLPEFCQWFQETELNHLAVISAIIGHHFRAKFEEFGELLNIDRQSFTLNLQQINSIYATTENIKGIRLPVLHTCQDQWCLENRTGWFNYSDLVKSLKNALYKYRRHLNRDDMENRLLMAMRSALIVSDSAASGLVREGKDIRRWLNSAFDHSQVLHGSAIAEKIINPRIIEIRRKKEFVWKDFQLSVDSLPAQTLMLASCGSGKTMAAWRWIKARADEHPSARVIFLYPTRGTSTEGFRDYVSWAPETDAALLHGTSEFELDGMFDDVLDIRTGKEFIKEDRLFALCFWQRRIFSATVDQFLGFMQNIYRSVCLLPLLSDSIIVIDEVHSFDQSLFSALKRFLQTFDIPVLCMTASLPKNRQDDLKQCGLMMYPADKDQFEDLQKSASILRYDVREIKSEDEAREIAIKSFSEGQKVLWVVNAIKRCQALSMALKALCYHSRFKLIDRRLHHDNVITAFQANNAVLAVTTQVCEMSLDMDADLLITEIAPVTSLIQRMGRCNRNAQPGQNKTGSVYIYSPENINPYSAEDMRGSIEFCRHIAGKKVSQSYLEELLEKFGPIEVEPEKYASFLECGPWAASGEKPLRDENDFTVQAVLDTDIDEFLRMKEAGKSTAGLIIPIPKQFAQYDSRIGACMAAPGSRYSSDYGFLGNLAGEIKNE